MELKITTLIENMPADDTRLAYEHGLSLYIEFDGKKLLFDTGQTGNYLLNAARLNKSIGEIDYMLISHGHYDHSGGVRRTLPIFKQKKKMYVGEGFFEPKYKIVENGKFQYNGVDFTEDEIKKNNIDLICVQKHVTYLTDKILIFKNFPRSNDFECINPRFYLNVSGKMIIDEFSDEIALGLITTKGLVVIVGCSHVGVVNILSSISENLNIPIYAVLGGTHLVEADQNRLENTLEAFTRMKIKKIAVSHCTGEGGIYFLQSNSKEQFILNKTGTVFSV